MAGYSDYKNIDNKKPKFAIISGSTSNIEKTNIKNIFNSSDNDNGNLIKIIVGWQSIKEGISFMRLNYIHMMDPVWNKSNYLQIIGRGIRYCSHKTVKPLFRHILVLKYISTYQKKDMVDANLYWLMHDKQE